MAINMTKLEYQKMALQLTLQYVQQPRTGPLDATQIIAAYESFLKAIEKANLSS